MISSLFFELMALLLIVCIAIVVLLLAFLRLQKKATLSPCVEDPFHRELIQSFSKAQVKDEFSLRLQPKISVKTGKICGAEVLVRWEHPKHGLISPDVFIALAEKSGFIVPLGQWILKAACEQAKLLEKQGNTHIRISVNLSAQQFKIGDIVNDIAKILDEMQLSPQMLEVELTESVFLENSEQNLLMLKVLRQMGVMISLDDFGTGYSSLKYLREFPLDAIKIDKTFIHRMTVAEENVNIVKAMVALAKAMHMKTVAEGVETLEEAHMLAELEVDELQGFHFYQPLTVDEFILEISLQKKGKTLTIRKK